METSIIIAGFGGQGVLFAGQLLAYAGMDAGQHVTWIPSYGPEMRGGTAHCVVIVSDEPIGAPVVSRPDVAVEPRAEWRQILREVWRLQRDHFWVPTMSGIDWNGIYDKYAPLVKPGGLLVVNSSLISAEPSRTDIDIVHVPANAIAEEWGTAKMLNMAALGAMLAARPILSLEVGEKALAEHLPAGKQHLVDSNLRVVRHGYQAGAPVTS